MTVSNATDLSDLFDAFNRHDIEGIMRFFDDACTFDAIGGAEVYGTRFQGKDAIAAAFTGVWTAMPDAQWADHTHFLAGDRGVSEWTFKGTAKDGSRVEAQGCDLFTLQGGKIVRKQAFRKNRPVIPAAAA
ncbi:nuclear transport factor 2 family protein [Tianweitania sediminis]|uniref:Nuclear transport factor 2 family protein n=1 Tax=Tianweitania sediminis TaxID=1502156 RepID=A0A8J7R0Z4_9HYPH|nr:nuclear transport factor 2 family protein [Tianweitania sediminis]MBP0440045.1 nuclear transport factor 2 family protein [Tianweitania sediminis]HEV7415829.1 nuclear transport factor 2 family protein [Tianweitania sediminis]